MRLRSAKLSAHLIIRTNAVDRLLALARRWCRSLVTRENLRTSKLWKPQEQLLSDIYGSNATEDSVQSVLVVLSAQNQPNDAVLHCIQDIWIGSTMPDGAIMARWRPLT